MSWLSKLLRGDPGDPDLLDHVPVKAAPDWRAEKLKEAAKRYGKPFECAVEGLPRKVRKEGVDIVVGAPTNVRKLPVQRNK